jgi:hypothetical protein
MAARSVTGQHVEDASFITGAALNLTGGEQYFF